MTTPKRNYAEDRKAYYDAHIEIEKHARLDYSEYKECPHNSGRDFAVCRSCTKLLPYGVCREEW